MSLVVRLSYEEKIINTLNQVGRRRRGEHFIDHEIRMFDAIRAVLQPLYDELEKARAPEEQSGG